MKPCEIRWINSAGQQTPDSHPMVGMAIPWFKRCSCYGMGKAQCALGIVLCEHELELTEFSRPFAICAEHEERMLKSKNWQLIPIGGAWRC